MQLAGQARMGRAQGSAGLTGRRGGVDPVGFLGFFFFFFVFPSPETTGERANKRLKEFASKRIAASRQVRKANKDALTKLRAWSCIHGNKWKIENMELTASTQAKVHPQGHPSPTGRHCRGSWRKARRLARRLASRHGAAQPPPPSPQSRPVESLPTIAPRRQH